MKNNNQAGKGDKPRPVKKSTYDKNFDEIKWDESEKIKKDGILKKGVIRFTY